MASDTTSSSLSVTAATTVERIALTTPFSPPNDCRSSWEKTSLLWTQDGTFTYPVLVSAPPTSCYPSGWGGGEADSLFTFSPAVCPSGWDYWKMSRSGGSPAVSTAYCCERFHHPAHPTPQRANRLIEPFRGFTFNPFDRGGYVAKDFFTSGCGRWVQTTASMTQGDDTTTTTLSGLSDYQDASALDGTFMVHQAWAVSWDSSERSDMTPMPLTLTDGLDTLWSLMKASPHVWHLFNSHSITIVDGILSGPDAILAPGIANAVRALILVRSKACPFRSLYDLQIRFLRSLFPKSSWIQSGRNPDPIILNRESLSYAAPSVAVTRSLVAAASQISALAQAFLTSCLERVRDPSFRPLHPANPDDHYPYLFNPDLDGKRGRAWDKVFRGEPVKVCDTGQPTWLEEMRAVRALWIIQLIGEIHYHKDNLDWPFGDAEQLISMKPVDFAGAVEGNRAMPSEEVSSMMDYLETLEDSRQYEHYRLPRPASCSGWVTALPNCSPRLVKVHHYSKKGTPFTRWEQTLDHRWGRTKEHLEVEAPGMSLFRFLSKPRYRPRAGASPIEGVKFNSFRPFGFAFWEMWRMHLLGMHSPVNGEHWLVNDTKYFYAWESVLPPDEVATIKAGLRLKFQKEMEERRQEAQRRDQE
ncbi:hypothetical protein FCOIX_5104 [Fusarium coicis]|nr:hypothetical protein FCOIX_5104 [Fusarium coicis]